MRTRQACYEDGVFDVGDLTDCGLDRVRRTVWDSAQVLYEVQMPDTLPFRENDSAALPDLTPTDPSPYFDPNPYFGRVAYTHGPGMDRPHVLRVAPDSTYGYLFDESGALVNRYTYSPFGALQGASEQVPQGLRFQGRELDAETGLLFREGRRRSIYGSRRTGGRGRGSEDSARRCGSRPQAVPAPPTDHSCAHPASASTAAPSARPFAVSEYSTRTGVSGTTSRATTPSLSSSRRRSESIRSVISGMAPRSVEKRALPPSSTYTIAPVQRRPISSTAR